MITGEDLKYYDKLLDERYAYCDKNGHRDMDPASEGCRSCGRGFIPESGLVKIFNSLLGSTSQTLAAYLLVEAGKAEKNLHSKIERAYGIYLIAKEFSKKTELVAV